MSDHAMGGATPEEIRQLANWMRWQQASDGQAKSRLELIDTIKERRFNFEVPPPEAKPRYLLQGKSISTPGNLTAIIAQAKAGKSAFVGALAAARFVAESGSENCDLLGVTAAPDVPGRLLWIDTEQSIEDFDSVVRRAIRRAGLTAEPASLVTYGLAGLSADHLRRSFHALLWQASLDGVFAAIVDGVADLCHDVNDAEECNALVAELHGSAIKYGCPIICVLHENPTHDTGKARGHLGSQLERKAESNLRLRKNDEVTVVFSERMRRAPILEKDGPRFRWCSDVGMHISCESLGTVRDTAQRSELFELADEVIGTSRLRFAEIITGIEKARGIATKTAEKRFTAMKRADVIKSVGMGFWSVVQPQEGAAA